MKTYTLIGLTTSLFAAAIAASSCNTAQDKINKVSEQVGESGGELIKSVTSGVDKAFNTEIALSDSLKQQGIALGKITIGNDSTGIDNKVSVYMIFSNDFKGTVTMKAFDNKNLEMGRVRVPLEMKKDDARYIDFRFDVRTNIDTDSKLTIE